MSSDLKQWNGWVMLTRSFDFSEIALPKNSLLYCYEDNKEGFIKTRFNGHLIRFSNDSFSREYSRIDMKKYSSLTDFLDVWKPYIDSLVLNKLSKDFLDKVHYCQSRGISRDKAMEFSALSLKQGVIYVPRQPIPQFYSQMDYDIWEKFQNYEQEYSIKLANSLKRLRIATDEVMIAYNEIEHFVQNDFRTIFGLEIPSQYKGLSKIERFCKFIKQCVDDYYNETHSLEFEDLDEDAQILEAERLKDIYYIRLAPVYNRLIEAQTYHNYVKNLKKSI